MILPIYKRNLKVWAIVIALLLCYAHFLYAAEEVIKSDQAKLILDRKEGWNIADGDTLKIIYTGSESGASALLRDSSGNASYWGGTFWSNYHIIFVNPNGITFGANANINAASFIASTLNISNSDFLNGKLNFYKDGKNGFIVNYGKIIVRNGGYVALLAGAVENRGEIKEEVDDEGKIIASLGTVVLASGEKMTLALDDINEISVVIDEAVKDVVLGPNGERMLSAVKNSGTISINGGKVILTAKVLNNVFDYAINNTNIIEAKSVVNHNGVIELVAEGAPIMNTGILEAGTIRVNAQGTEFINKGKLIAGYEASVPDSGKIAIQVGSLVQGGLISADKIVTVEAERISVVLDGPLALEIDPWLNTSPGVIIQAPEVRIISKQFGSNVTPLNIKAALATYIYRTQGDINILESLGIGTSVLLRGPPDDFGAIVYNRDTNLTLQADHVNLLGSAPTYFYGNITFSNFTCTVPDKEIYFEAGKTYTFEGSLRIEGLSGGYNIVYLKSSQQGTPWYIDVKTQDYIFSMVGVGDSYNIGNSTLRAHPSSTFGNNTGWNLNTVVWTGAVNNLWSNAGNWNGGTPSGQAVEFTSGAVASTQDIANLTITSLTINGYTGTITVAANLTINTNLDIGAGATVTVQGVTLIVNGATNISGTLSFTTSAVGTKTFNGLVTINSGGTWSNSINEDIAMNGGLENNGTFTSGTAAAVYTFGGTNKTIGGTNPISFGSLTINGTIQNNGTLTVTTNLAGSGTLTNAGGATLNIGDSAIPAGLTLDASAAGNTVNYNDAAGTQDIKTTTYHHLTISGGGIKTLVGSITVNGTLTVSAGTLDPASFTITGSGANTLSVTGIIKVNAATFAGNYTNFLTRTLNAGSTVDYSGTIAQTIDNTLTYSNLTISGSGSTKTLAGAITVTGNLTIGAGATLDVSVNNYGITIGGSWTDTGTGHFTPRTGTVTFNGTGNIDSNDAFYNIKIDTAGIVTLTGPTAINGDLVITAGSTLSMNTTLSVTGLTDISGTLTITGTGGTKTFNNIKINNGGAMSFSAAEAIVVNGNLQVDGTGAITGTSGTWTFQKTGGGGTISGTAASIAIKSATFATSYTNSMTLDLSTGTLTVDISVTLTNNGTITADTVTDNGTLTNNGTITVSNVLGGSGTLTQGENATLNIADATIAGTLTLTATATGNTVNYNRAGAQTVKATIYYHLTLSGSGAKTLTGLSTINGNFTLSGTATATTAAALTIGGNLDVGSGTTLTVAGFDITVSGTSSITGTLTHSSDTGAKIYTGLVTINNGGVWNNSGNAPINFRGGLTNNGTFTAGSGVYTFDTNSQAISGTVNIPSITVTGITLTNNGTLTVTTALSGTGGLTNGATGTLNINFGGEAGINTLTASAAGNTVNYGFAGDQTIKAIVYHHLIISGSGTKTLAGATTVNGTLTVAAGTLDPSTYTITGNGTNTLSVTGTIKVNASTFAGNYTNFLTRTLNAGSTVDYSGTNQTVDNTLTYQNLTISGSGTKSLAGATTVNGTLTVAAGTLDPSTYTITGNGTNTLSVTGTIKVNASTFAGNYTNFLTRTLNAGSTVDYSGTNQTVDNTLTYQNLIISGSGTKTLGNNTTVNGNLIINTGTTLDTSTYTLGIAGDFTVNGALAGSGVVSLSGSNKNIDGSGTIANPVTITNAKTILSSANLTFNGAVTMSGGAADVTNNGTVTFTSTLDGITSPTWTNAAGSTLNYAGATLFATSGILDADANPNTVNYNSTSIDQTVKGETYYHLKVTKGARIATLGAATIVDGNLTITSGTLNTSTRNLTVNGNTNISGTLNFDGLGATRLFVGLVTIDESGTWDNSSVNDAITLRGGLTNNGTFTAGTGIYTFNTNSQSLNGTFIIPRVTITGVTLTNNGTLTVSTALAGTGTLAQGTNATLEIGDSSIAPTLDASAAGNTVNYNAAADQTLKATTYHHLTLSGSGTKTAGGALTVNGDLTTSGTAVFAFGAFSHNFYGNWTINSTAVSPITATAGSTINFNTPGTPAATSLGGSTAATLPFVNLNINNTSGFSCDENISVSGTLTIASNVTFTPGATNIISGGGTLSGNGTAQVTRILATPDFLTQYTITNKTLTNLTVEYAGAGAQTVSALAYGNLKINMPGQTATLGGATTVNGNLTISAGTLSASTYTLTIGGNWINDGTFNAGSGTVTFNGSTTISGSSETSFNNVTINIGKSLTGPASGTINVSGNWTNSGTFTHNSGTVKLNGSNAQSVTTGGSGSAFNTLTITNNSASGVTFDDALYTAILNAGSGVKKLSFSNTGTHTITTTFNVNGSSGNLIELAPKTAATVWNLDAPTSTVNYVNVNYSQEAAGKTITAQHSTGNNNTRWIIIGDPVKVNVETAADGSGTIVGAQDLAAGSSIIVYAIARDSNDNFSENIAADSWALTDITGGVLSGNLAVATDNKSATLTGNKVGTAKIEATSGTLTKNASGTITVIPGQPASLVFVQQPSDTTAGSKITSAPKVEIRDAYDNLRAADNSTITIALGNNPGSGSLSGTLTQTALSGVATFSGLAINKAGDGYSLKAASGDLTPAISGSFNIAANPSDSQVSNATVARVSVDLGLYQFSPFIPGGGAGYLYQPLTPTDISAFDQSTAQPGDYSFLDGALKYTGSEELKPFFEELDKKESR